MFRIFKELTSKWTIPGWLVLLFYLLVHILDWADRLESIQGKVGRMMPLLKPAIEFLLSSKGQVMILVIGLLLLFIATWRKTETTDREKKENNGLKQPKEPQPVIVAIDELKTLRYEGERLVNRFQIDSVKPTLGEVENWRKRMRECARQNVLATENLVSAKDLLKLDKRWDEGEVLRITAEFVDHGCFADGSVEMAVFQSLWGHVQRLKELIAKIESEESTEETNSQQRADLAYLADPAYDRFWPSGSHDVTSKTPIELIDEAVTDGERVETFCEGFHPGYECKQRADTWVEKTKNTLRKCAPNYVAMFNDTVAKPFPTNWLPQLGRPIVEVAKWKGDEDRYKAWRVASASVTQLRSIRAKVRAKLPS
jgi:hypothetical protein